MCTNVSNIFNIRNRGFKLSKKLSVLRNTTLSAALIEVAFISNAWVEKYLKVHTNIDNVTKSIKHF